MTVPHGPSGIVQILAVESPDLASSNNNASQRVNIQTDNILGNYEGLHI
jgi:predicted xylose isomerase-like sugar epimerase